MSFNDMMRFGMPTISQILWPTHMVIFSSRLLIYMRLAFIPGIIIAMIKSTLHSITNVPRNTGD
jgi:hypothetical protein